GATIEGAVEAVCLKAMALAPVDRYPTPKALAEDVERWMADEPVSAWSEPWWVRERRWIVRHRSLLGILLIGAAAAIVSLATIAAHEGLTKRQLEANNAELSQA